MRVGLVCPYSWDVPGGVQEHIRDLAEALIDLGHTVSVISPADDDAALPSYVVPAGRAVAVPYNGSVARLSFGPLSANRVRRWIRDGSFDVLHVHEPAAPSLSLIACWVFDGPIVATVHGATTRSRALHAAEPMLRSALEKVSGRIAVSEAARTTLVHHLGGDAVLIPNGVTVSRFEKAEPLAGWPGEGGAIVVVLGQVSEAVKVQVYHSVDVFCAPNTGGESFGIVLAEAMAAGAPIVASDLDAFRRVLRGGRAGELFTSGDAADLAAAIGRLLDDPQRRAILSAAASAAVRDYDWTKIARDVVKVYEAVLPASSATATAASA